jgi:D-glycero-D-manno-heptose 1,7-bisphosphate phosphatase
VKALFLDRDGVINQNRANHVLHPLELRFVPGSLEALALLANSPFRIVVVTNQAAIGRGYLAAVHLEAIHARMLKCVRSRGGRIDAIYVCPHRPDEGCKCRKPGTALLERAATDLNLDLAASYLVGDATSDLRAAVAAGCQPVLVLTGRGRAARQELPEEQIEDPWVVRDLKHAVELILAREHDKASCHRRELQCVGT